MSGLLWLQGRAARGSAAAIMSDSRVTQVTPFHSTFSNPNESCPFSIKKEGLIYPRILWHMMESWDSADYPMVCNT